MGDPSGLSHGTLRRSDMPRNEFKPDPLCIGVEGCEAPVHYNGCPGQVTPVREGPEDEALTQEVDPVEDDPELSLAELRKSGQSTTDAHIARPAT